MNFWCSIWLTLINQRMEKEIRIKEQWNLMTISFNIFPFASFLPQIFFCIFSFSPSFFYKESYGRRAGDYQIACAFFPQLIIIFLVSNVCLFAPSFESLLFHLKCLCCLRFSCYITGKIKENKYQAQW